MARDRYHHGDLRDALLDAVAEIIREHGIGFVSLREAARRARVSHSAPAHHFRNKAGLLTAFATRGYERLAGSVLTAVNKVSAKDGPAMLETLGASYVRFAVENPEQFSIMFRPAGLEEADAQLLVAREAAFGVLMTTMHRCAREGFLDGIDVELAALSAWSLVHGLASLWLSGRLADRVRAADVNRTAGAVARLFVDGVLRKSLRPPRARR
jgi:AcrR family transcriptional regulator